MGFCTVLTALLQKSMGHQNPAVKKRMPFSYICLERKASTTGSFLGARLTPALVPG